MTEENTNKRLYKLLAWVGSMLILIYLGLMVYSSNSKSSSKELERQIKKLEYQINTSLSDIEYWQTTVAKQYEIKESILSELQILKAEVEEIEKEYQDQTKSHDNIERQYRKLLGVKRNTEEKILKAVEEMREAGNGKIEDEPLQTSTIEGEIIKELERDIKTLTQYSFLIKCRDTYTIQVTEDTEGKVTGRKDYLEISLDVIGCPRETDSLTISGHMKDGTVVSLWKYDKYVFPVPTKGTNRKVRIPLLSHLKSEKVSYFEISYGNNSIRTCSMPWTK